MLACSHIRALVLYNYDVIPDELFCYGCGAIKAVAKRGEWSDDPAWQPEGRVSDASD